MTFATHLTDADSDSMATMLNCEWSVPAIAAHYGITPEEVLTRIRESVRRERAEEKRLLRA